jgi:membrane protein
VSRLRGVVVPRVRELHGAYADNDLLTKSSAISYQVLFALVPAALAGVALLGFIGLEDTWERDLAPRARAELSPEAFSVLDDTITQILGTQELFWITGGLAFALYQVSGAVRATMGALNDIYGVPEERPFIPRVVRSVVLAVVVSALLGVAIVGVFAGGGLADRVASGAPATALALLLAWALPLLLAVLAVTALARFGPASAPAAPWVGVTSAATVVAWLAASVAFRWYATEVASYSSIFGGLASIIVLMTYLYISANVFLAGWQIDALVRRDLRGRAAITCA